MVSGLAFLLRLRALLLCLFFCSACAENQESNVVGDDEYYEFQTLSLKVYGIPARIMLPDVTANIGASTKPEVVHNEGDFIWDIKAGPNFEVHIEDYGDYNDLVDNRKKELKNQDVFNVRYLVDEKDIIVFESTLNVRGAQEADPNVGVTHQSFHVYAQKTIDGITYELRSPLEGCDKNICNLLVKSVRSFKPIK